MKIASTMIAWNPGSDQVQVGPWPDKAGWSHGYAMTIGACLLERRGLPEWQAIAMMLLDFHTIVVRDRVDPQAAHKAFLAIDEYRQRISPDLEGAE